ncbi:unnamed protein product [Linum trigynum]|uniref:Uncharacterized protein n=1 Tax=Linum trigynum TaxID=586398 RepID=A0AAV2CZ98_9ROSI
MKVLDSSTSSPSVLDQKQKLEEELAELEENEENYWKQISRADWLTGGDKNTNFFHRKATARWKRNTIWKLRDDLGRWYVGQDQVFDCMYTYYSKLFTARVPPESTLEMNSVQR